MQVGAPLHRGESVLTTWRRHEEMGHVWLRSKWLVGEVKAFETVWERAEDVRGFLSTFVLWTHNTLHETYPSLATYFILELIIYVVNHRKINLLMSRVVEVIFGTSKKLVGSNFWL